MKEGTYLYGHIECDVQIIFSPIRYGTGDTEDGTDWGDDVLEDTYYLLWGSTTVRGSFNAGGGAFTSLQAAVTAAELAPGIGRTVRWRT